VPNATPPPTPGRHNDLTDVTGIRVGHHDRRGRGWLSGTTVVLTPPGTVGSVDVRGGGPSTRETDALAPTALVDAVHAVVLSGGSSYGLAAATGVMEWLGEHNVGFPVGPRPEEVVPIVAAACLFDLGAGGRFTCRPDASFGRAAAAAATTRRIRQGGVGAGTGAHAGALKGGLGSASVMLPGGITVAALVAVNPGGSVVDPATGGLWGAPQLLAGEIPGLRSPKAADLRAARADGYTDLRASGRPPARPGPARSGPASPGPASPGPASPGRPGPAPPGRAPERNTVLAVVATDAALTKGECARLATAGHDGMARSIRPVHTMTDGDVVFALATGGQGLPDASPPGFIRPVTTRPGQVSALMEAAADTVARAIVHAVVAARGAGGMPSYLERYPSARR
jgi:L-aminopeptidase/D-esterase-like protein